MAAHFGRWKWKGVFVMLLQRFTWLGLVVVLILSRNAPAQSKESAMARRTAYRTMKVDGLSIFYREAGPKDAPTILLLHGFPSSSRMFEPLFARLSDRYHLVAPGLSGLRPQRLAQPERVRIYVRSLRRDHEPLH